MNGHTFSIKSVRLQKGDYLTYDLKPLGENPSSRGYALIVENTRQNEGFYQDMIILETDSDKRPSLRIPVSARIRKAPSSKKPAHD
jgi:hypothetical protein